MKHLFWTIAILLIVGLIYLTAINLHGTTSLNIINVTTANWLHLSPIQLNANTAALIALTAIATFAATIFELLPYLKKNKEKEGAYERRLEKTEVSNDASTARIKVLEAKIQTLEKALQDALKRN